MREAFKTYQPENSLFQGPVVVATLPSSSSSSSFPVPDHSLGNEISPIHGRNVGPIRNRFHAHSHPDDPNTIRTVRHRWRRRLKGGRGGIFLPSTGKGSAAPSPPSTPRSLPWALALFLLPPSLPPSPSLARSLTRPRPPRARGKYLGSVLAIAINGGRRCEQRFRTV